MEKTHNIALFIDGDNVSKNTFQDNFNEIKLKGRICIKRIYFDFNSKLDEKWKSLVLTNGIESVSVLNLPGKNSTDIRLMLDMIKEYYSNPIIDIYIIMSSDSDFYHIATFLRSCGKKVICYGEKHTPMLLKNVCDEFILCKNKSNQPNILTQSISNLTQTNNNLNQQNFNVTQPNKVTIDLNSDNIILNEEEQIYNELRQIDFYCILKTDIKHNKWTKYPYYIEYKNKIYIVRDTIEYIKLINQNKNLENKNLSILKDLLKRADSSFNEKNWNFYNFKDFVNSIFPNQIETTFDPDRKIEIITKINM